ncbi:MAG: alkaline phosphatase [Bacteroidales bacterium]|jgi:alkaline phosphatase|nr:alkaline phosphatase [Bacteroidales bacterium]
MKRVFLVISFFIVSVCSFGQNRTNVKPVKNVIVMIPDGTSIGVVSAARWFQLYNHNIERLNLDPYMCGTVTTFCSNAPIGDSAPTTSCYMTGVPQRAGFVSTYSPADPENDLLYPLDPSMAYQPLATVLEAARLEKNKATGLVVTCEFSHATPADCASHYYQRGKYKYVAPQIAYNQLDVVFGGGNSLITEDIKDFFKFNGTTLIQNDVESFRNYDSDNKVWALFNDMGFPFDLDRDDSKMPSLAEMTQKAIDQLSKNKNGFFLMVEGSIVDGAAHANDAIACITEFIAFDKAVGVAMDFAEKDGKTAVIILSDHGNSGFTLGRRGCGSSKSTLTELFQNVSQYKKTSGALESILRKTPPDKVKPVFHEYTGINLTDDEFKSIVESKNYQVGDYTEVSNSRNMRYSIVEIMNSKTCFGFTSGSHTGEEVFLAAYHPSGHVPLGRNTNVEINQYLCKVLGLKTSLPELTKKIFSKHTEVLAGYDYVIENKDDFPVLKMKKDGKELSILAFSSRAYVDGKPFNIGSVTVYMDKTDTFYLPADILTRLKFK